MSLPPETEPPTLIASGSMDGTVRVWSWEMGRHRLLVGHRAPVFSVCLLDSGDRVASGSWDKTVRVWDLATGKQIFKLRGHKADVNSVCSRGRALCSASDDETLRVWNNQTGEFVKELVGHSKSVNCCEFLTRDYVVSGSADCTVSVWDWRSGLRRKLVGHRQSVLNLSVFAQEGSDHRIASSSKDMTVHVWNVATGGCASILEGHGASVWGVAFVNYHQIVSASWDRTIRYWNIDTGDCLRVFLGHQDVVNDVGLLPSGDAVVSCSRDKTVRVWSLRTGEEIGRSQIHDAGVSSLHSLSTTVPLGEKPDERSATRASKHEIRVTSRRAPRGMLPPPRCSMQ